MNAGKHEPKHCERCGAGFECRVGDVLRCQCSTVPLNDHERQFIANRYDECLCAGCLAELKLEHEAAGTNS